MTVFRLCLGALFAAVLAAPAGAQLFKWVDDRGVVNYGDRPPAHASNARTLDAGAGTLSIVPGMAPEEIERLRERETQARLERLEREVEELRAREYARASAPAVEAPAPVVYGYPVYPFYPRYRARHFVKARPIGPHPPGYDKRPPHSAPPLEHLPLSVRKK